MKKQMARLFAILCAVFMMISLIPMTASKADGSSIYVSATGSDETGDGTEGSPYATLVKAYNESSSGDTIVLLSDIAQSECVSMWHDLTIKSKDGEGPYTVTRQEGFATTSDNARSWYNPAMFETHPDIAGTTVTFANIILDDNFKKEGTKYEDQPTAPNDTSGNLNIVQDGIISLYNDPDGINKCTVILENGTTLQNFGGMSAVNIEGYSELIMKEGSEITNHGTATSGSAQGVWVINGSFIMEEGAKIHDISGSFAVFNNVGTSTIGGEVYNYSGTCAIRATGKSTVSLTKTGNIHDMNVSLAAMYCYGGPVTFNIDGKLHDITSSPKRGGIWPSNGNANVVNITENAELYNIQQAIRSDLGSTINMSGGSIHDNGIGIFIRRQSVLNLTGGEIKDNRFGVLLAQDPSGTNTMRTLIDTATADVSGNDYDYFIDYNEDGFLNRSYTYYSAKSLKTEEPIVGMGDMDADNYPAEVPAATYKTIKILKENTELYLGNASAASKTALNNFVTNNFTGSTVLATWFAQTPESSLHVIVSELAAQTDPVYVVSYPVDASGAVSDNTDPIVYAVTQDTAADGNPIDVIASAGSEYGRSYAIFAAPDMYTVIFDSQGGSAVPTEAVADGQKAHEPLPPTYRYRSFEGWYTEPECTTAYDFDTPVTQDITLYAKWALVTEDVDLSKAKIFKNVTKSENVTYDSITFTFKLEPYAVKITPADLIAVSDMPAINDLTITMSGSETRAKVTLPTTGFPIGGVYTYKVTEIDGGAANWTYDDTVYYIDLEIEEDASGKLVLNDVVVHKDTADGTKTDLEFTNIYAPQTTLEVSKTVEGDGSNPLNNQKEFTFTITFTDPGLPGNPSVATDGMTVSYGANTYGKDEALSYNVAYTFKLKNGEKIAFNMPVGTQYTVTEQGEEYYTPSAVVTEGGTTGTTQQGEYATDLTVGGTALTDNDDSSSPDNKVDFTNEYSITPPTGVKINTEIIVIGAIILAFMAVGFVLTRRFRAQRAK